MKIPKGQKETFIDQQQNKNIRGEDSPPKIEAWLPSGIQELDLIQYPREKLQEIPGTLEGWGPLTLNLRPGGRVSLQSR